MSESKLIRMCAGKGSQSSRVRPNQEGDFEADLLASKVCYFIALPALARFPLDLSCRLVEIGVLVQSLPGTDQTAENARVDWMLRPVLTARNLLRTQTSSYTQ